MISLKENKTYPSTSTSIYKTQQATACTNDVIQKTLDKAAKDFEWLGKYHNWEILTGVAFTPFPY
jgi:hypothetical protein